MSNLIENPTPPNSVPACASDSVEPTEVATNSSPEPVDTPDAPRRSVDTSNEHASEVARLRTVLDRLAALHVIDRAITEEHDLSKALAICLRQTVDLLRASAASILLYNQDTTHLQRAATCGVPAGSGRHFLPLAAVAESSPAWRVVVSRQMYLSTNPGDCGCPYVGVPLLIKGRLKGVLEIYDCASDMSEPDWAAFLKTLAGQIAVSVDNAELLANLQMTNVELTVAYDATIEGWSRALDLRDHETEGHSRRVTEMTLTLAETLGYNSVDLVNFRRGALLHDIGKVGIPDGVLLKPGPLDEEEWQIMRMHPVYAYDLLSPIAFLAPALDIPYCHHEKWNGAGYPRGLRGEEIPAAARIFAVVDVWDALCSDRPYRQGWAPVKVMDHIREHSGSHFDPEIADAFLTLVEQEPAALFHHPQ